MKSFYQFYRLLKEFQATGGAVSNGTSTMNNMQINPPGPTANVSKGIAPVPDNLAPQAHNLSPAEEMAQELQKKFNQFSNLKLSDAITKAKNTVGDNNKEAFGILEKLQFLSDNISNQQEDLISKLQSAVQNPQADQHAKDQQGLQNKAALNNAAAGPPASPANTNAPFAGGFNSAATQAPEQPSP